MFGKTPVIIAAALAAIIQGVMIFVTGGASASLIGWEAWLLPLITLASGLFGEQKTVAKKTVEDAGLSPEGIKASAQENTIARKRPTPRA